MGWSSSIHLATSDKESVLQQLTLAAEHNCFVGVSGDGWVGVYSERCERSGGIETSKLAKRLSIGLNDPVIGILQGEDAFSYWLFQNGRSIDEYPIARFRRLFFREHKILDLAIDSQSRQQMLSALESDPGHRTQEPVGVSGQEFIEKAIRDLTRVRTMTPDERDKMMKESMHFRSKHYERLNVVCRSIGIMKYDCNYSDFAQAGISYEGELLQTNLGFTHVD